MAPPAVMLTASLAKPALRLETPAMAPTTWPKVPSRLIEWENEGLTLQGSVYLPEQTRSEKVPLVVVIHGGPASRFDDGYWHLTQLLVAQGWAVFQPNIRGSTGYGAAFMAAVKNELGGADCRDVMTGIDALLRAYPLDAQRMALIGHSYGGEMAAFAVGRTDRFKAIIAGNPVTNQFSEYGTERDAFYDHWYLDGNPWTHFEAAWRQSAVSTAHNARTPLLLLQAEEDETDPLNQSLEMYRALRFSGAPVTLVIYPRVGHESLGGDFRAQGGEEPWHGVDVRRRMFAFLRAAFAGEADPLAAARAAPAQ